MPSPNTSAAIDVAACVLLAHAEEIAAARAMAHPATVVGVVPIPEADPVRIHHTARGILPAIAAYESLSTLIVDPRPHLRWATSGRATSGASFAVHPSIRPRRKDENRGSCGIPRAGHIGAAGDRLRHAASRCGRT